MKKFILFLTVVSCLPAFSMRNGDALHDSQFEQVGFLFPACTATMITKNTAITANHCLFPNVAVSTMTVVIGGVSQELTAVKREVLTSALNQEIALIRFKEEVRGIQFPKLSEQFPASGSVVLGVGFGTSGKYPRNDGKLSGTFKVSLSQSFIFGAGTQPMIEVVPGNSKSQLPCSGDSGGPLFSATGDLLGIVSFGIGSPGDTLYSQRETMVDQCQKTRKSYYVPIASNLAWIRGVLKKWDR